MLKVMQDLYHQPYDRDASTSPASPRQGLGVRMFIVDSGQ